jgi:hypothetical protein
MRTITAQITLIYGNPELNCDIKTNGVPHTLIIESLNNIVKGMSEKLVRENERYAKSFERMEEFLDALIQVDRDVLAKMLKSIPEIKNIEPMNMAVEDAVRKESHHFIECLCDTERINAEDDNETLRILIEHLLNNFARNVRLL